MFQIILFLIFWIVCGIVACGLCFATEQRPYGSMVRTLFFNSDRISAEVALLLGPVGLLFAIPVDKYHGWLWPWGAKAREEAGLI